MLLRDLSRRLDLVPENQSPEARSALAGSCPVGGLSRKVDAEEVDCNHCMAHESLRQDMVARCCVAGDKASGLENDHMRVESYKKVVSCKAVLGEVHGYNHAVEVEELGSLQVVLRMSWKEGSFVGNFAVEEVDNLQSCLHSSRLRTS